MSLCTSQLELDYMPNLVINFGLSQHAPTLDSLNCKMEYMLNRNASSY